MNEISLIQSIARWTHAGDAPGLVAGIGDDCAILRPEAGEDLLITTDLLIEGVHFKRSTHTGATAGWKALARGLSDIAAMGGTARYALFSIALGPWTTLNYVRDFYRGVNLLAKRANVRVIGGDVSKSGQFHCDVVVIGSVPQGEALRRNGARPGDIVYVSGKLGGAAVAGYRHRPEPRLELGAVLRTTIRPSACMDLSDGLAMDLHRLCEASGVAAKLDTAFLPLAPRATLEHALSGGEDYELLFTASPRVKVPASLGVSAIGTILAGKPGTMWLDSQKLKPRGWDPLAPKTAARERSPRRR